MIDYRKGMEEAIVTAIKIAEEEADDVCIVCAQADIDEKTWNRSIRVC